ncbi:hypothetical protein D3C84_890350 [compost metagenome]
MIDGEQLALRTIASHLTEHNSVSPVGLVFPEDPNIHLSQDSALVNSLCKTIGLQSARNEHLPYPVNGVFWSVPATLSPLVNALPCLKTAIKEMHLSPLVEDRILAQMLPMACVSKAMLVSTTFVAGVTY